VSTLFSIDQPRRKAADLDASDRIALGDELLREFPDEGGRRSDAFKRAVARLNVPIDLARDCMDMAEWFSPPMRKHIFGRVQVSYSTLREAALDHSGSGMPDHQRWDTLRTMIDAAVASGHTRVTAAAYRKAIGGRPIPNQADAMPPEAIVRQMGRPEVWLAVLDHITGDPVRLRDVLMRVAETGSSVPA